jgi:phage protein D
MAAASFAYPVRHPRWVLTYSGVNISGDVSGMVTEILYSDQVAHASDEVEVTLEDRDRRWQGPWFPQHGDVVSLLIGYDGEELLPCGDFQVDELELKGPPDTMHMKCIAAGITPSIRTPRSAGYESQTLQQIAQTVAKRHGMTVVGAPGNINVTFARVTQRHETDLKFLRRLAQAHNYDFSVRGQRIVFYWRTQLEQNAAVAQVVRTQVKSFEFKTRTQQIYKSATVAYQNPETKTLVGAQFEDPSAPTGDDLHIVTRCENPQQATLKAEAALHGANMLQVTGRIELEGTTLLVAGSNVGIQGFGVSDGTYHIDKSTHRLARSSGYTTEVEVRRLG